MGNQAIRQHQDDSRRHQHIPSKSQDTAMESAGKRTQGKSSERISKRHQQAELIRFLRRYPLSFLMAAWVMFMLMAGVAILDMTSLGAVKPQVVNSPIPSPEITAMPSEAPIQPISPIQRNPEPLPQSRPNTQRHDTLPLLSLMAIALSCAVGCMLLLQGLKPRRLPERSDSPVFSKSVFSKSASHRSKASGIKATSKSQRAAPAQSASASAIVPSVVPSNISQPLDWDEPSLADHLDLRQQRPLSHWL